MKMILSIFFLIVTLKVYALDNQKIECEVAFDHINKLDQITKERESKGLDVSNWYKNRNKFLAENSSCPNLKDIKPTAPKVAAFATSSINSASNCSTVDLRKKLSPLRNQGNTGWCFAYAASDLLTAKLGKEISAVSVAINFKTDSILSFFDRLKGNSAFRSGTISSAILASRDKLCLESELPSDLANIDLEKSFKNIKTNHLSMDDCISLGEIISQSQLNNFIKITKKLSERESLKQMAEVSCKKTLNHKLTTQEIKKSELISGMNGVLDQGQIIGISIDPRFWEEGKNYKGKKFDHSVSVVGRKWDSKTNSCRYLIRNSMGTDCRNYDPVYSCEKGYTWVPETTLYNNTEDAYYLKKL